MAGPFDVFKGEKLGIEKITNAYKEKISASILPPDPLRIINAVLKGPPAVEHLVPLPPVLETVHYTVVDPLIESLPRLPLTGDFPIIKPLEWRKE